MYYVYCIVVVINWTMLR